MLPRMQSGRRSRCVAHWGPFLAPTVVRREPSAWGFGQWTLEAFVPRRTRPCCAESSPYVRRPSEKFDAAFRRSSVKARTPRSVTRTLACHIAESHNFSPPPSPAIAVSATFRRLARLVDARAGSEMASTPSPYGVLSPLTFTQNENAVDPRGVRAVLFSGYRFGYWGTPVWPTPASSVPPCTGMAAPRCTGRRSTAIAESSDRSSHSTPT